jgi:hypothetical protein
MKRGICFAALLATVSVQGAAPAGVPDLGWLAGAWCSESNGIVSEEYWTVPRGGLLLGMHRDTRQGSKASFEFLRIELRSGGATYQAQPGGRAPTAFELHSASERSVAFRNDRHDFPKRIIYERLDTSRLRARVDDGTDTGTSEEWVWSRCADRQGL